MPKQAQIKERKSNIEKNFKVLKQKIHPIFGEITLWINPVSRNLIFSKDVIENDKEEALKIVTQCEKLKAISHENVINILDFSVQNKSKFCSDRLVITVFFPFYKTNLISEIQNRAKMNEDFTGEELTLLLFSLVRAHQQLMYQGITVSNLKTGSVIFDPDNKIFKLHTFNLIYPYDIDKAKSFQLKSLFNQEQTYCSPESYEQLIQKNLDFYYNQDKENSFALGLIVLEAGLLESIQNIYQKQKENCDSILLKNFQEKFNDIYQKNFLLLVSSIHQLLQYSSFKRITIDHLYNKLPNYEEIKSLLFRPETEHEPLQSNFYNPIQQKMDVSQIGFYSPYLSDSAMKLTQFGNRTPLVKKSVLNNDLNSNHNIYKQNISKTLEFNDFAQKKESQIDQRQQVINVYESRVHVPAMSFQDHYKQSQIPMQQIPMTSRQSQHQFPIYQGPQINQTYRIHGPSQTFVQKPSQQMESTPKNSFQIPINRTSNQHVRVIRRNISTNSFKNQPNVQYQVYQPQRNQSQTRVVYQQPQQNFGTSQKIQKIQDEYYDRPLTHRQFNYLIQFFC